MSKETKKSDTHEERYFHLDVAHPRIKKATVFARKEDNLWFACASFCHKDDSFDRRIGRQVARRKYFDDWSDIKLVGNVCEYQDAVNVAMAQLPKA